MASLFHWVSGIKEAYKGLLNGDILEGVKEIPPPPKIEVIQFNRHKYKCRDCGHEFTAKDAECPQKGRFGVNLLVYLIMLKLAFVVFFAESRILLSTSMPL